MNKGKEVEKVQKVTSKGQITLPVAWRKNYNTDQVLVSVKDNKIEISPLSISKANEYTVFDAIRDNKGRGIKASDMQKILRKIDKEKSGK